MITRLVMLLNAENDTGAAPTVNRCPGTWDPEAEETGFGAKFGIAIHSMALGELFTIEVSVSVVSVPIAETNSLA